MSKIPSDDVLGSRYKLRCLLELTIRESDQLKAASGIVRHGISSEGIDDQLSNIEDDGKKEYRSETTIAKL